VKGKIIASARLDLCVLSSQRASPHSFTLVIDRPCFTTGLSVPRMIANKWICHYKLQAVSHHLFVSSNNNYYLGNTWELRACLDLKRKNSHGLSISPGIFVKVAKRLLFRASWAKPYSDFSIITQKQHHFDPHKVRAITFHSEDSNSYLNDGGYE
jgi:hypothetical protein